MASLEEELAKNTAELKRLNDNIAKGALGATAGKTETAAAGTTGKGAAGKGAKKPTMDDVRVAVLAVQEKFSKEDAQAIIKKIGGVPKMADIPEAKFAAVIAAATAKLEAGEEQPEEGGDEEL